MTNRDWPRLELRAWEPTYKTLHRWLQIVGKIKMRLAPPLNHWWHVTLFPTPHGLSTLTIPRRDGAIEIAFDFVVQRLVVRVADGRTAGFALEPMSVAAFYERLMHTLHDLGIAVTIWPVPVELPDRAPFTDDYEHCDYDAAEVARVHRVLLAVERVFAVHRGRFIGKASPVHLFWGAFDFAVTRFSGRRNPSPPADRIMGPAYSHEVISHGWWPGGDWPVGGRIDEAVFYAYAVPEPPGFARARVEPAEAFYHDELHEFLLPYEAVRRARDPEETLLGFLASTYRAGAIAGSWPPLEREDPLAPPRATDQPRSAEELFADHLHLAQLRRFDEDIARNFAPDCIVIANGVTMKGHEALRRLAERLAMELPRARFDYRKRAVAGDVCVLEWAATDVESEVDDGVDTFVVRDGKIVAQTIHYTVSPRRPGAQPDAGQPL